MERGVVGEANICVDCLSKWGTSAEGWGCLTLEADSLFKCGFSCLEPLLKNIRYFENVF